MRILNNIKFKKIIVAFLIVSVLITGIGPNFMIPKTYAADTLGILLWPLTALLSTLASAAAAIIDAMFQITGGTGGATPSSLFISHIVYNEVPLFNANFFDSTQVTNSPALTTMLSTIQTWYLTTRNIAVAASLTILVFVGVKILLSTAAGDKAKYKSLLKDWLLSLVLIFTLHYIMSIILYACDALTGVFKTMAGFSVSDDVYAELTTKSFAGDTDSIIYAVMKWILIILTLLFVLIYSKRLIMIAFLTIIAPLAAISYSVDKIRDGQSQILDKWTKEYLYTALMMPMDALLFTIIWQTVKDNLQANGNAIFSLALVIGFVPIRGWFNEFLGTDRGSKVANAAVAGAAGGALAQQLTSKSGSGKTKSVKDQNSEQGGSNGVDGASGGVGLPGGGSNAGVGANLSVGGSNPAIAPGPSERVTSPESGALNSTPNAMLGGGKRGNGVGSNFSQKMDAKRAEIQSKGGIGKMAGRAAINMAASGTRNAIGGLVGLGITAATGKASMGIGGATLASKGLKGKGSQLYQKAGNAAVTAATVAGSLGNAAYGFASSHSESGRNADLGASYSERIAAINTQADSSNSEENARHSAQLTDITNRYAEKYDLENERYESEKLAYMTAFEERFDPNFSDDEMNNLFEERANGLYEIEQTHNQNVQSVDYFKNNEIANENQMHSVNASTIQNKRATAISGVNDVVNNNLSGTKVAKMRLEGKTDDEIFRAGQRKAIRGNVSHYEEHGRNERGKRKKNK